MTAVGTPGLFASYRLTVFLRMLLNAQARARTAQITLRESMPDVAAASSCGSERTLPSSTFAQLSARGDLPAQASRREQGHPRISLRETSVRDQVEGGSTSAERGRRSSSSPAREPLAAYTK